MKKYNICRCLFMVFFLGLMLTLFFFVKTIFASVHYNKPYRLVTTNRYETDLSYPYEFILYKNGRGEFRDENGKIVRNYYAYYQNGGIFGSTTTIDNTRQQATVTNSIIIAFYDDYGKEVKYTCYEAMWQLALEVFLLIFFSIGTVLLGSEVRKYIKSGVANGQPPEKQNDD